MNGDFRDGRRTAADGGFGLIAAGLWLLGLWAGGAGSTLGRPAAVSLALCGILLIAVLLGADRPPAGSPARRVARAGWALLAPAGILWALNYRALGFWWIGDDPCHLVQVLDHGIWRPFVDPVGYFLTPLLNLSLGLDLRLFGLDPRAFYAHQLASFTILLAVAYGFLRSYLKPAFAGLALTLFVVSSPAIAVAQQQMNRHYLEGLILVLASFALYRRSLAAGRPAIAILGAALYLLATAAKEVFVPMVMLLPFLAAGGPPSPGSGSEDPGAAGRWWRYGIPYAIAAACYGLWRLAMLGWNNGLTAYGALSGEFHGGVLLHRIPRLLGLAEPWRALVAAALLVAALWILSRRSKRFAVAVLAAVMVFALPLIPVAGRLEPRHLFVAALAVSAATAAALQAVTAGRGPAGMAGSPAAGLRALAGAGLLLLGVHALTLAPIWTKLEVSSRLHRAEGSFLLDGAREGVLLTTIRHSHFLQCLVRLDREIGGSRAERGPGLAGYCGDLCYCSQAFPERAFWQVSDGRMVPVQERAPAECDARRPLDVDLRHDLGRGRLGWRLGPYGGEYQALLIAPLVSPGIGFPISIPRQGSMPFRLTEPLRLVLKYASPEGWQTYSSIQVVEPGGRSRSLGDGARDGDRRSGGARHGGARHDGARHDGARNDGARNDEARHHDARNPP